MSNRTSHCSKIAAIIVKHDLFRNTFFPSTIIEWNKLDWKIKSSESIETLKKRFYHSLEHLLIVLSIVMTLKDKTPVTTKASFKSS